MEETHKASPEMQKFFEKLLALKAFVEDEYLKTKDETLKEIYNKLDSAIKEDK